MEQNMFCYQCQETAGCSGCTKSGVCGKRPETAALQDLLIWTTKGLSAVTTQLRREGKTVDASVNHLITENLFTTITNVNFDDDTIRARIEATLETKALLAQLADCSALPEAALWNGTTDEFAAKAVTVGVLSTENEDIRSLRELITYGLKGLAAYTSHANVLLKENEEIDAFLQRALAATLDDSLSAEELTALALETGSYGVQGMARRSYYSDFAQALPKDTVILTAGCAKYKYNKLNLGDINGIPRVLDAGQCNDSYSLAVIALKLKEVFGLDDINDLPIIYNISWYEQKAVIVLLALLSLGVKNIHLGPTLPAFLSPNVAALLVENFGIAGIDTVENDMELFFGK